jgi:hypothetical protein
VNLYGQEMDNFPTLYFVFAYEAGSELRALAAEFTKRMRHFPVQTRVDCACVLDKGVLVNRFPAGTFDGIPGPVGLQNPVPRRDLGFRPRARTG